MSQIFVKLGRNAMIRRIKDSPQVYVWVGNMTEDSGQFVRAVKKDLMACLKDFYQASQEFEAFYGLEGNLYIGG